MRTAGSLLCAVLASSGLVAQARNVDARLYAITVTIPDTGSVIQATVGVFVRALEYDTIRLDLEGMQIDSVWRLDRGAATPFAYDGHVVSVPGGGQAPPGIGITYHGVPQDGLIIGNNAHGHRVAFADNWPERARYWIPTLDHPADKALVSFKVRMPSAWRVVSNGTPATPDNWVEGHPIPTYTMVIGAGELSVSRHRPALRGPDTIPIDVWTYPEDSAYADSVPFRRATEIVEVMQRLIGPFPYENLKHVESSTRFGGMENATAIFYAEKPYVERKMGEGVVRHESAHQWFGDAVTEKDWPDLWLSEGFATYFDGVVGAALDGDSILVQHMRKSAQDYFASDVIDRPIVDSAHAREPMKLLNANSYPKGAWVLHMLRGLMGDSAFFGGLRTYYRTYRDSNATSADFARVMETAANADYGWFFRQWLHQPGYPRLNVSWQYDAGARRAIVGITQGQKVAWGVFRLPNLTLEFRGANGTVLRRDVTVTGLQTTVRVEVPFAPAEVRVDPDGKLLLQATAVGGGH
jgi:aminopeptidase N